MFPRAIRRFDLSEFDLIVSSSHCVAKGVDAKGKPHLCYCHTPMRYVWDRFDDYFPPSKRVTRAAARLVASRLRAAGAATIIVFTSSRDGADFGSLISDSGGSGFIPKAELTGEALRAFVA